MAHLVLVICDCAGMVPTCFAAKSRWGFGIIEVSTGLAYNSAVGVQLTIPEASSLSNTTQHLHWIAAQHDAAMTFVFHFTLLTSFTLHTCRK